MYLCNVFGNLQLIFLEKVIFFKQMNYIGILRQWKENLLLIHFVKGWQEKAVIKLWLVWSWVLEALLHISLIILCVTNLLFIIFPLLKYCSVDFLWLCCLMVIMWETKCNPDSKISQKDSVTMPWLILLNVG